MIYHRSQKPLYSKSRFYGVRRTAGMSGSGGFSLFEMLVTITILAIITSIGILNLANFKNKRNFDLEKESVVEALRNAQNRSISGENGAEWGVRFTNNASTNDTVDIFSGSYSSSTTVYHKELRSGTLLTNPSPGHYIDIVFAKRSGTPSSSATIDLQRSGSSDTTIITVGALGTITTSDQTGLVGHWPMDEGSGAVVYDASGNANDGTVQGSPTWQMGTNCKSGTCLSFNGSTDYITATDTASIDPVNAWTLSAWVNRSSTGAQHSIMEKYDWSSGKGNYLMRITSADKLIGEIVSGTSSASCGVTTTTISSGSWYFLAVTFDNSSTTITCYVNGVSEASNTSVSITPASSDTTLKLACRGNDCGTKLNGMLDDVRIYNRALSADEIKTLYESY